jgi:hypothetical protein
MFDALAAGQRAKYGGQINVHISDLNDLSMSFYDIVGFADQVVAWVDEDPQMKRLRRQYEQALAPEIKDREVRSQVVSAMFGPEPSAMEEAKEETIQTYSKVYEDEVRKREQRFIKEGKPIDKSVSFAAIYTNLLENTEPGKAREWHRLAIMSAAKRALSASEYQDFLMVMDDEAEFYIQSLATEVMPGVTLQSHLPSHAEVPWQAMPAHRIGAKPKSLPEEAPWWAVGVPRE